MALKILESSKQQIKTFKIDNVLMQWIQNLERDPIQKTKSRELLFLALVLNYAHSPKLRIVKEVINPISLGREPVS